MYSKVKILGHPIHPMLVNFPIAFYTSTLVAYIIYKITGAPFWFRVGFVANVAGVGMALVAAIPGFLDWSLGIPSGTGAKRHGLEHMLLNVTALVLFAITLWINAYQWGAAVPALGYVLILPIIGFLVTLGAGYLGWTLVQSHHVGVQFTDSEQRCMSGISVEREPRRKRAA
jgi:uncharacterized membrane protein